MRVKDLRLRPEVERLRIEPAIDLSLVVSGKVKDKYLLSSIEFFKRTYLTPNMRRLVIKALMAMIGLKEAKLRETYSLNSNLILLPTEMGGGKTHSLVLLYHIVKLIRDSSKEYVIDALQKLDDEIAEFVDKHWEELKGLPPKIVVVDCTKAQFAPSPISPLLTPVGEIYTIWGFIAYQLNRYDIVKEADKNKRAPFVDVLASLLSNTGAIIMIDEIGRYYGESGLDPSTISNFLMNLADAATKYNIGKTAIIVSLPKEESEYIHDRRAVEAVNRVLGRVDLEQIVPVGGADLPNILRKRLFEDEDWKALSEELIEDLLKTTFPDDVESIIKGTDFIRKLRETYPFHPGYIEVLEKLIYKLGHLQRTRDALRIAVRSIHAIMNGQFDFLEEDPKLVMPYHMPIFSVEFLNDTVLKNAPMQYKAMELALKTNVVKPKPSRELEKLGPGELIQRVLSDRLKELGKHATTGFKLGTIIWLHSLIGLGLPSNMGLYPSTRDLVRYLSPTREDVKGVLARMSDLLPQLVVHGEIDNDKAKWYFSNIPPIDELLDTMKEAVTTQDALSRLARLLEEGIQPRRRGRRPKKEGAIRKMKIIENVKIVLNPGEVPDEVLSSEKPSLIVFARPLRVEELSPLLCGRNFLVSIAPYIEGLDEPPKLTKEDIRMLREIRSLIGRTHWDALMEILRYLVAAESLDEESLKMYIGEGIKLEESKDLLNILKGKVESKKNLYLTHAWRFIKSLYKRVYYCRMGEIQYDEGLILENDRPLAELVQESLLNLGRIEVAIKGEDILKYHIHHLGRDPERDDISLDSLWKYLTTTEKSNVPIIPFKSLIDGFKDLLRRMDYIAVLKGNFIWKKVYGSRDEALRANEGDDIISMVVEAIKRERAGWRDLRLVHWKRGLGRWLESLKEMMREGEEIVLVDRAGNEYLLEDLTPSMDTVIRVGRFFRRKKEYELIVTVSPTEIEEKSEATITGKVEVKGYSGPVRIRAYPIGNLRFETNEWSGENPVNLKFNLIAGEAVESGIRFSIAFGDRTVERVIPIRIKGERRILEDRLSSEIPDDSEVLEARTEDLTGLLEMKRILEGLKGSVEGTIKVRFEEGEVNLEVKTSKAEVLQHLYTPLRQLVGAGGRAEVDVRFRPHGEVKVGELRSLVLSHDKIIVKASGA